MPSMIPSPKARKRPPSCAIDTAIVIPSTQKCRHDDTSNNSSSSSSGSGSSSSRNRETAAHPLLSSPCLMQILSYHGPADLANVAAVNHHLYDTVMGHSRSRSGGVGNPKKDNDDETSAAAARLWKELTLQKKGGSVWEEVFVILCDTAKNNGHDNDEAALWRRLLRSHVRHASECLVEGDDFYDVSHNGLALYEPDDEDSFPHWMKPLESYRFRMHLWDAQGSKVYSVTVPSAQFVGDRISLDMDSDENDETIPRDFQALEIEVLGPMSGPDDDEILENGSVVLYSSAIPLDAYSGGNYEEYSAVPWFTVHMKSMKRRGSGRMHPKSTTGSPLSQSTFPQIGLPQPVWNCTGAVGPHASFKATPTILYDT